MIDRRTFMLRSGAAAAAFALPVAQTPARPRIGLQLFTLNRAMNADPVGTLKRVAAMGYQEVETYGINPASLAYYGMPARDFASLLRDLGLPTPSGHYDIQNLLAAPDGEMDRYVDRCAEGARVLGQQYVTWPYLAPPTRTLDTYRRVAAHLNRLGARLAKSGLQVAYHNGGGEFIEVDGRAPFDIILAETDPALVKLQIDLYWLSHDTRRPPRHWFDRAPGRYEMWHVKDMHKVSRDYTELGNGTIDYTKIWPDARMSGMKHFFVEQGGNFAVDPFQSAADGMAYVKRHLVP